MISERIKLSTTNLAEVPVGYELLKDRWGYVVSFFGRPIGVAIGSVEEWKHLVEQQPHPLDN